MPAGIIIYLKISKVPYIALYLTAKRYLGDPRRTFQTPFQVDDGVNDLRCHFRRNGIHGIGNRLELVRLNNVRGHGVKQSPEGA